MHLKSVSQPGQAPGLQRVLGTFDLVLLNIAAIVGLRWLSTAAQLGPASLTLWIIAFLLFFVPSALTVQELSSRIPHVGGLYRWTQAAFGDVHGFLAGWAYWISNLVFFPSLLLFVSGIVLHTAGASLRSLDESPMYNGIFCLTLLWLVTLLNILGLRRAKWLQNIGGLASIAVGAQVLIGGAVAWWRFGSATRVQAADLVPNLQSLPTLNTFAILMLAFVGLELGPILGDEIRNSARTIRRAILISGAVITVIYVAGTASLLVALPPGQIGVISGIPEAMEATGQRIGMPMFGVIAAALLALTSAGGLGAWISGTARLPFAMGLGPLPARATRRHPSALRHAARRTARAGDRDVDRAAGGDLRIHDPRGLPAADRHDRGAELRRVDLHLRVAPGAAAESRGRRQRDQHRDDPGRAAHRLVRRMDRRAGDDIRDHRVADPARGQRASDAVPAEGRGRLHPGVCDRLPDLPTGPFAVVESALI
jgi:hypothetical protein